MDKTTSTKRLLRRFLPYYYDHKKIFFADTFCASLTTLAGLALPILVRDITNTGMYNMENLTSSYIFKIGFIYILLRLIDAASRYYMASYGHIMGSYMETDMRSDLFQHLQKLSFDFYDEAKIGQIMARMTSDLFDVTEFAHHGPETTFIASLNIIVSFIILLNINVELTLIVFAIIPVMVFVVLSFHDKLRNRFKEQRVEIGEINSQMEDSLLGIRVVKSFCNEKIETQKFEVNNDRFLKARMKSYFVLGEYVATYNLLDGLMYITMVIVGAFFMKDGQITPGDFFAFMLYIATLLAAVKMLIQFSEMFMRGVTGIERFFELMDIPITICNKDEAIELSHVDGEIVFVDAGFSYEDNEEKVLEHINIHIHPGEHIAVVGPSGGGKTTMCNLIPRFYDVNEGKILIDGYDLRDLNLKSLRDQIGFVQQDVYLFSGTIFDNIAYGKAGATRKDVIAASKLAGADEFISQLHDGYDTFVGQRGLKLSGGQKQRISIARVFLKNPPILILDEATSALDNESERLVQKSLEKLAEGRTTITIAHRLTTIKNAERILVLTDNGIEEQGSHDELIAKKGLYFNLYKSYSEEF